MTELQGTQSGQVLRVRDYGAVVEIKVWARDNRVHTVYLGGTELPADRNSLRALAGRTVSFPSLPGALSYGPITILNPVDAYYARHTDEEGSYWGPSEDELRGLD